MLSLGYHSKEKFKQAPVVYLLRRHIASGALQCENFRRQNDTLAILFVAHHTRGGEGKLVYTVSLKGPKQFLYSNYLVAILRLNTQRFVVVAVLRKLNCQFNEGLITETVRKIVHGSSYIAG